jgi:hypothetical protein
VTGGVPAVTSTSSVDPSGPTGPFERGAPAPAPAAFTTGPVLAIGAAAAATIVAVAGRYGYHRDELYFVAGGARPDAGYVDHPPLTALLARAVDGLAGGSVYGLRLVAALLVLAGVVGTALLARELGGGRTAQLLAAFTGAAAPVLRGHNAYFGTTGLDQLMWLLVLLAAARLLRTADPRWWLPAGLALGVGLETKTTIAVLGLAVVAGLALERRWDLLRTWWFAAGAAVALLLWTPNLIWNATHDWAFVTFSGDKRTSITDVEANVVFLVFLMLMAGITTAFVWWPGLRRLLHRPESGNRFRPLGLAAVGVVGAFFLAGSKYYYVGPVFLLLFAAGSVELEAGPRRTRTVATWMVAASIVLCAPVTLPLLPAGQLNRLATFNRDFPEMVGWPELADQVEAVVASLPGDEQARTVVLTTNYGEAAALEHFAPGLDVYSGHNSYWTWGPPPDSATTAVLVGFDDDPPTDLCRDPVAAGTVTNDAGLDNYEAGRTIWLCHDLVRPWSEAWPDQQQYT